jgi:hypothetical protein
MNTRFYKQEKRARRELKNNRSSFKQKRETILVRVQKKWRKPLKRRARERKKTISKLHDKIYSFYFRHNADDG